MEKAVQLVKNNLTSSFTPKQRLLIFCTSLLSLFFFALFTLIVRSDILRQFDFNMTVKIQDKVPVRFDDFFTLLSIFGRFEASIIILSLLLLAKRKIMAVVAIGFFGFSHIVEIIGKSFLSQPGPPHMFLRTTDLSAEFPGFFVHTDASYPSGHSLRVVFIFIILFLLLWRSKKIPAFLKYVTVTFAGSYMLLMLFSRISLGEHWTTDVIGGSLLGAGFALLSLLFL